MNLIETKMLTEVIMFNWNFDLHLSNASIEYSFGWTFSNILSFLFANKSFCNNWIASLHFNRGWVFWQLNDNCILVIAPLLQSQRNGLIQYHIFDNRAKTFKYLNVVLKSNSNFKKINLRVKLSAYYKKSSWAKCL